MREVLQSDLSGTESSAAPSAKSLTAPKIKSLELLTNGICENLLTGEENTLLYRMDVAASILKWSQTLSNIYDGGKAVANAGRYAGKKITNAAGGLARWWKGVKETPKADAVPENESDRNLETSTEELLVRGRELTESMKEVMIRIGAIESTEDTQLKQFCAKEMLETIQNAGGLWPKISQNLAVRPDLVEDQFTRDKLKETQSGNKDQGTAKTLDYIQKAAPQVDIPGIGPTLITDFMDYRKFLSAGSVGQVDIWDLRRDTANAKRLADAFVEHLLPSDLPDKMNHKSFIVKTVFEETEQLYTRDWNLLDSIFTNFASMLPKKITTVWDVLKNIETSIFDEFDLRKEAHFTQRGRAMMKDFTETHQDGKAGAPSVTTPLGIETSSKYVMMQTIAPGIPLNSYLERSKGQWDRLAEWRTHIYTTILNVFGFSAIRNGFFQSDPHPGNWYWDTKNRVLTLIDWGGVEDWTNGDQQRQAHCDLAHLYSGMGQMSEVWDACDSVILDFGPLAESKKGVSVQPQDLSGTYRRDGISVHMAAKGEDVLLLGHTYAVTYKHATRPYTLWYDGKHWKISEIILSSVEVTKTLAQMNAETVKPSPDQTFFGLAWGTKPRNMSLNWVASHEWSVLNDAGKTVARRFAKMKPGRTEMCEEYSDRTQAYQMAANHIGISLQSQCDNVLFLDTTATPNLEEELLTDKTAMVCIKKNEKDGSLKGTVGVPPKAYKAEATVTAGETFLHVPVMPEEKRVVPELDCEAMTFKVMSQRLSSVPESMLKKKWADLRADVEERRRIDPFVDADGEEGGGKVTFKQYCLSTVRHDAATTPAQMKKQFEDLEEDEQEDEPEENGVDKVDTVQTLLSQREGAQRVLASSQDRIQRPTINQMTELTAKGVGKYVKFTSAEFEKHKPKERTMTAIYDQAQRAYALAASFFDSDVAEAGLMGLRGRQSLSIFTPGKAPEIYTLFARCAVVFHGMMLDVIQANSLRLVPLEKLQWLLQPQGDRFFQAWKVFADAFMAANPGQCPEGKWATLTERESKFYNATDEPGQKFYNATDEPRT